MNQENKKKDTGEEESIITIDKEGNLKTSKDRVEIDNSSFSSNSDGSSLTSINKNVMRKNNFGFIVLVVVIFIAGFFLGGRSSQKDSIKDRLTSIIKPLSKNDPVFANAEKEKPEDVDFDVFWEAWRHMDSKFVDVDKLDSQKRVYGAIKGMVSAVGDPYSAYMDPEETKEFNTDMDGSFEGIGAELGMKKGMLTVIAPLEGMPAEEAGLRAGDIIVKVFDEVTLDMTVNDAVKLIRGEKGTDVKLTVAREATGETLEISITRGTIELESVKYEKKEGNIGYIKISKFLENTGRKFDKAVITAQTDNIEGLIIDVRNNPGGYLNVAVDMISTFVPKGEVVVWEKGRNDDNIPFRAQKKSDKLLEIPIVVIMNGGSASASEIMAGALRDIKGVKLVGEKSFGKGSVQQVQGLRDNSSMRITIAKWLTPKGDSIHEVGLDPDIEVKMEKEDYEQKKDPQFERALEELKNEMTK